ncbi:CATRA conflict system CASPASE/TPR repeat-associated protein [Streptomyces sp. NPDC059894]|uniref:CATRA conflict system CASPASE/TPR repeat-associated protein n=1 Tax=unclassified Streptomyces TaxID=2593676 RepID=UPI0036470C55
MTGPAGLLDQHLVVHLYAPAEGPGAPAAHRALHALWNGCRLLFGMTEPIAATGLPPVPPADLGALPLGAERALAAQERPGTDCQAVLRLHQDVLNLSVSLASDRPAGPTGPAWGEEGERWRAPNRAWSALTDRHAPHLLGQARLYLARVPSAEEVRTCAPPLYARLHRLLPAEAVRASPAWRRGIPHPCGLALWETGDDGDGRALRRFLVAVAPDDDPAASAWLWSRGDTALPPFARYLLHAAKLRYQLRVWQRDNQARELRAALETLGTELRRLGAGDRATAGLLRLRRLDSLLFLNDLRALRRTVDIAADNLRRAVDLPRPAAPGTPFADDADLARSFLERLDDDLAYLGLAVDGAGELTAAHPPPAPGPVTPPPPAPPLAEAAPDGVTTDGLTADRPTTDRPTTDRSTTDRARADRARAERPTTDRATADRTTTDRSAKDGVAGRGAAAEPAAGPAPGPAAPASGPAAPLSGPGGGPGSGPGGAPGGDRSRNVFVVHGRDAPARDAFFVFLRALGLCPLEWEDLVALTGSASPFLGEVIARAMPYTQAVVVLMTPEDVVRLHPDLHEAQEAAHESRWSLQARPNVLLELGMALVTHPDRTVIVVVGDQRPVSDLGGRNFVQMSGAPGFRAKVASRLRLAGCPVDTDGQDWLTAGDFTALTAYDRRPPGAGP